jgi:hypothetical protein
MGLKYGNRVGKVQVGGREAKLRLLEELGW